MPSKAYKLPASWLKEGSAIINVSTFKNVDEEDVLKVTTERGVRRGCVLLVCVSFWRVASAVLALLLIVVEMSILGLME